MKQSFYMFIYKPVLCWIFDELTMEYDIVIIGYGAAGFSAMIKASELSEGKASIALVGRGPLGGTCVNVGCVPSKYLLEISNEFFYSRKDRFPGVRLRGAELDFEKVMDGIRGLVGRLREEKYAKVVNMYDNVDLIEGDARFISRNEVSVETEDGVKKIKGEKFIIATGSRPAVPPIQGLDNVRFLTSNDIWHLGKLPGSVGIVGGGAIGLELGQALLHFGSDVAIMEAMPRIAHVAEAEISEFLAERLAGEGMRIFTGTRVIRVSEKRGAIQVEAAKDGGRMKLEFDELLVATGRKPNTDNLGLESAGVETDRRGFIKTDKAMRTTNPNIFAAGDVVSKRLMLETLAAREGAIAAVNALRGNEEIDYMSAPWAIFTYPQVAAVGYTEEEYARVAGQCSCRTVRLSSVPKARILHEEGLVKVVVDPRTGRVVGVHVLAPNASEFIVEGALAIRYGLTIWDVIETVHVFPTLSESIKLASQAFIRRIDRMSCCVE